MRAKALEIRDCGTFIPALAVDMNPTFAVRAVKLGDNPNLAAEIEQSLGAQKWLLRRCGYPCDGRPNVIVTRLDGNARAAFNDPYDYSDRTWRTAHLYIIEHWDELKDGDVIDVEFILGETPEKKVSERHETIG